MSIAQWGGGSAGQTTFVFIVMSRRMLINMREGGRETEISPHRHHIRQTSRRNRSTESYSVTQLTYWAFIICHLIYQRNQYIFQSPRQWETVTLHRYMITGTSAVYWLVGQWDTHWDICWAAQQNILSLIKVDNKLTQLQLLVIGRSMSGWGWYMVHWYRITDGARHYFLFMVLFY